jgi:hypothetical protein
MGLLRHPLKKGTSYEGIEKVAKEFEVDEELGLPHQQSLTAKKALEKDIEDLTSSKDYFEVSDNVIKKLFQIRKLQTQCTLLNIKSVLVAFLKGSIIPLSLSILVLALILPMISYSRWVWPTSLKDPTASMITLDIFNILSWVGMLIVLIVAVVKWCNVSIAYPVISVKMKAMSLKYVTDEIPFGAKLKVLEAKKTGIFEDFIYTTPEFEVQNIEKNLFPELPSIDPAILGVTLDSRKFMIVYWDIKKDIEKVTKQIEHFKKFKLNK